MAAPQATPVKRTGWKDTRQGWAEEPCPVVLPGLTVAGDLLGATFGCQKTVPTRNNRRYPHVDHWWEGKIAGRKVSIAWKE